MTPFDAIPAFPRRITLEFSASCNLGCGMCPRRHVAGAGGFMDRLLFKKLLKEIEGRDVEAVVPFFRGESLLHPDCLEMLALLKEKTSAKIQLATNALLLDAETSRQLLRIGLDFISFSLDAVTRETYEKIRIGGDFDLAVNNVHTFLKLRKNTPSSKTETQVSATENDHNKNELPSFIDYWKPYVDRVRIYPEHSRNGRFGELARGSGGIKDRQTGPCRKLITDMVIYHNGVVALCNHDWDASLHDPLGTVTDQRISDIWNGNVYQQIRESHLSDNRSGIRPCEFCDHKVGMDPENAMIGRLLTSS